MRQRVALARSLAQDADILLMDEPFGALDAMTRDILHDELERIWREQRLTVLFVTHNVREAVRLGDRVILLSSRPGRVIEDYPITHERPRRIDSPEVAGQAAEITDRLRAEVARHAQLTSAGTPTAADRVSGLDALESGPGIEQGRDRRAGSGRAPGRSCWPSRSSSSSGSWSCWRSGSRSTCCPARPPSSPTWAT